MRIDTGLGVSARSVGSGIKRRSARSTDLIANIVAAETISAVVALALIHHRARSTVERLAHASAIAIISVVAWHSPRIVHLTIGHVLTSAGETGSIAGLARFGTCGGATNAINTKSARTLTTSRACGAISLIPTAAGTRGTPIAIAIGALVLRIGPIEDIQAQAIATARQSARTSLAKLIADVVAAISVDAVPTQAIGRLRAGDGIESLTRAISIASIRIVARRDAGGIDRIIGDEGTSANRARKVTRFARIIAGRSAADAIGTEAARAFPVHATRLTIVAFARAHSIARVSPGTYRCIVRVRRDVRASTKAHQDIARHALTRARIRTANAVRAKSARAFGSVDAASSKSVEAHSEAITRRTSLVGARGV
jgi:hypothetical protein